MLKAIRLQHKRERKAAKRRDLRKRRLKLYETYGTGQGLRAYQIERLDAQLKRASRPKELKLRARADASRAKAQNRALGL